MRLVFAHLKADTLELLRYPAFSVPTLVFPTLFFSFFVVPGAVEANPNALMAFYAAFAVLGVAFFQFGVSIANDRVSPWNLYLRTLPIGPGIRFPARVLSALQFAFASAGLVVVVATAALDVRLAAASWLELAAVLLAGSIPFALLGISIGYWLTPGVRFRSRTSCTSSSRSPAGCGRARRPCRAGSMRCRGTCRPGNGPTCSPGP